MIPMCHLMKCCWLNSKPCKSPDFRCSKPLPSPLPGHLRMAWHPNPMPYAGGALEFHSAQLPSSWIAISGPWTPWIPWISRLFPGTSGKFPPTAPAETSCCSQKAWLGTHMDPWDPNGHDFLWGLWSEIRFVGVCMANMWL